MKKFKEWLEIKRLQMAKLLRQSQDRGIRGIMAIGILEVRQEILENARIEAEFTAEEWTKHFEETGEEQSKANAERFAQIAQTMRDLLELTK